jgi:hypothetical protein
MKAKAHLLCIAVCTSRYKGLNMVLMTSTHLNCQGVKILVKKFRFVQKINKNVFLAFGWFLMSKK